MIRTWKWICDNPTKHKTCSECYGINSSGRKTCVKCGSTEFQVDLANIRKERFEAARRSYDENFKIDI